LWNGSLNAAIKRGTLVNDVTLESDRDKETAMSTAETVPSADDEESGQADVAARVPVFSILLLGAGFIATLLWICVLGWGCLRLFGLL
jgi:hypothetical protein